MCKHLKPYALGSARTEVVRFVGCGGLAPLLAPGRGTYGSVWSAAFQRCKKRAKILKWRQMRAFSGSVSEWCGRAVAARLLPGSCPVPARFLPGGRFLPGSCPAPARFLPGSCPAAGSCPVPARFLVPSGRLLPGRFLAGSWPVPARQPGSIRLGRAVAAQEPGTGHGTGLGSTTLNRPHRWHSIAIGSRVLHHACGVVRGCFLYGFIWRYWKVSR